MVCEACFLSLSYKNSYPDILKGKQPRNLSIADTIEVFHLFNFPEESNIYEKIQNKNVTGDVILDRPKGDLVRDLDLKDKNVIKSLVSLRIALRKADFNTRVPIDLNKINVKSLQWDGVCQLLEEQVGPKHNKQRETWYKFIENESIDGSILYKVNIKRVIGKKGFNMNRGQKEKFADMVEIFQQFRQKVPGTIVQTFEDYFGSKPTTVNITYADNSQFGVYNPGGNIDAQDINVNEPKPDCESNNEN